jgi:hypothetical protein
LLRSTFPRLARRQFFWRLQHREPGLPTVINNVHVWMNFPWPSSMNNVVDVLLTHVF